MHCPTVRACWHLAARLLLVASSGLPWVASCPAQVGATTGDVEEARAWLARGRFEESLASATRALADGFGPIEWHLVRLRAELALGRYEDAVASHARALQRHRFELELYWVGAEAHRRLGDARTAEDLLVEIERRGRIWARRYDNPRDRVFVGRAEFALGGDAKTVLDRHLARAKREDPTLVEARLAIAEVALEKHDYALAADELRAALALAPQDATVHTLLAQAFLPSDPARTAQHLEAALAANPRHVPARLLQIDQWIAADEYDRAAQELEAILALEPRRWEAWAYRAVLSHLAHEPEKEAHARTRALDAWKENPGVDHLIGRELSEKYRFAEGAAAQRRALALNADFLPAKFQLAQDLLRLGGDPEEGWTLAEEVLEEDPYQVVAYNLMTLKDRVGRYVTLETDGLALRMAEREAAVYGREVLELLARARATLAPRYAVTLERTVTVELFEEQKDFAIRTFGLPGGAGYLGVCFGDVVTMNSPASQGATPANWRSVLWHEFCHVVTLNKTHNRMPRWLSEGISVWEERREDPRWGQAMTPAYREFVLAGRAPRLSALGASFLRPEGPFGLSFAYYQSSLVVEWLVETHGHAVLLAILDDLADGRHVYAALERRVAPVEQLDAAFDAYLRDVALTLAGARWDELPPDADLDAVRAVADREPRRWSAQMRAGRALAAAGRLEEAAPYLERALELYPADTSPGNAHEQLADWHRARGDEAAERRVLERRTHHDASALAARLRLAQLQERAGDWDGLARTCEELRGIQPMLPDVHRLELTAARARGRSADVLRAGETLLTFDPLDVAAIRYELARAHRALGDPVRARREVLLCLAEAPRFREALALLLEWHETAVEGPQPAGEDGRRSR